jgi:hypothetical protein
VVFARAMKQRQEMAPGAEAPKVRAWLYFSTGLVIFVLAMLAKPTAVVVPVIVAAIDFLVIRRHWKKVAVSAGVWLAAAVPFAVLARIFQDAWRVTPVAWWQKPLIAADVVTFYLWKLVWPVALAPDYGRRPTAVLEMWGGAWVMFVWIVPVAVGLWVWWGRRTRPWVVVGAVAFLAVIGPVLGFTPFMFQYSSSVADHYLYLAMFGPALVLTWAVARYPTRVTRLACGGGLAALALLSMIQTRVWRDDLTLWTHNVKAAPHTFVAHNNLAAAYGRQAGAIFRQIEHSPVPLDPAERHRLSQERRALLRMALAELYKALEVSPDYITAHRNAYSNSLRLGDEARAAYHVEQFLRCSQEAPEHMKDNFIPFQELAARLQLKLQNYEKAAQHYENILRRVPNHEVARAGLEGTRKKLAEARVEF